MKTDRKSWKVKVYYRVFHPSEPPGASTPLGTASGIFTDEPTAGRYVTDRHSRYAVLELPERSDAELLARLERKHPAYVVAVDQVEWLPRH